MIPVQGGVPLNYHRSLTVDTGVQLSGLNDQSIEYGTAEQRLLDRVAVGQLHANLGRYVRCTLKCLREIRTPSGLHLQQASTLHPQQTCAAEGITTRILDLAVASEAVTMDGAEVLSEAAEQRAGAVLDHGGGAKDAGGAESRRSEEPDALDSYNSCQGSSSARHGTGAGAEDAGGAESKRTEEPDALETSHRGEGGTAPRRLRKSGAAAAAKSWPCRVKVSDWAGQKAL